ncbi:hypothetical protein [Pedobacter jamesrossensis]|uniref:Uncharacterized protein n=1 Tax=Pedobacter jamesrossensis TaxID=1908238 RepID=A0ABV8NQN9_9SPHI
MRKNDIGTGIKKYLPLFMGIAFACLLVFFSHSSKARIIAFKSCPKITSFEKDLNKIANITPVNIKGGLFSNPEGRQSKYRKKFQMGGDSYIEFKAAETVVYKLANQFRDPIINYHTPNVITAVVLFMHRLASF